MRDEPEATDVLSLLSLLPDGIKEDELDLALPNMSHRNKAIRVLEDVALITRSGNAWKVLAPIRAFVMATNPPFGQHLTGLQLHHYAVSAVSVKNSSEQPLSFKLQAHQEAKRAYGNIVSVITHALLHSEPTEPLLEAVFCATAFELGSLRDFGFRLLNMALLAARNIPPPNRSIALLLQLKGLSLMVKGDLDDGERVIEESKNWSPDLEETYYWMRLAQLNHARGKLEEAERLYLGAYAEYQARGDALKTAHCTRRLGQLYLEQGKLDEAYRMISGAIRHYVEQDHAYAVTRCHLIKGRIEYAQGKYKEAIDTLVLALGALKNLTIAFARDEIDCRVILSMCYWRTKMFSEAGQEVVTARVEFEEIEEYSDAARCMLLLVYYDCLSGQHQAEHEKYAETMAYCTRHDLNDIAQKVEQHMARCSLSEHDPDPTSLSQD